VVEDFLIMVAVTFRESQDRGLKGKSSMASSGRKPYGLCYGTFAVGTSQILLQQNENDELVVNGEKRLSLDAMTVVARSVVDGN